MARLPSRRSLRFGMGAIFLALALLVGIGSRAVEAARKVPVALIEQHGQCSTQLMEAATIAYSMVVPDLSLTGTTEEMSTMISSLYPDPASIDFFVAGQPPAAVPHPASDALLYANTNGVASFPVAASAIVNIYNLPGQTIPLLLTRQLVVAIMLGDITTWDDPRLAAQNPGMTLPAQNITMVLPLGPQTQTLCFTQALKKFSSGAWTSKLGAPSDVVAWPVDKYAKHVYIDGKLTSYVLSVPYTFSYALISNARPLGAQIASMINQAGQVVVAGTASINYAFLELGTAPNPVTGQIQAMQDMSDGSGYESWPMTFAISCYLPLAKARTTCLARAELVNFWLWFLASGVVQTIAESLSLSILPALVYTNLNLNDFLRNQLRCEDEPVAAAQVNTLTLGGVSLASIYSDLTSSYLGFYGSTDPVYRYTFAEMTDLQAVQQLSAREIDAALIVADQFIAQYPDVGLADHIYDVAAAEAGRPTGDLVLAPYAVYAVVPLHNLPTEIQTAYAANFPLVIDVDTLGRIFSTDIASWTHPAIEALNPGLTAAFAANPTVSTAITLVMCCKAGGVGVPQPVTNALVSALNATSSTFHDVTSWTLPAVWTAVTLKATAKSIPTVLVASEKQMEAAVARIPGAIGYKLSYSDTQTITKEFSIQRHTAVGTLKPVAGRDADIRTTTVSASIAALTSCVQAVAPSMSLNYTITNLMPTAANIDLLAQCWPLRLMASVLLPASFTTTASAAGAASGASTLGSAVTASCNRGNHTASVVNWLLTDAKLDVSSSSRGIVRLSAITPSTSVALASGAKTATSMRTLQMTTLNSVTCDGETLLITKPRVWQLSSAVTSFGWALASLGLIATGISTVILFVYRQRAVLRSSSVPFQFVILAGLAIIFLAIGLFGSKPSTPQCQTLAWLLNVGFTLMFAPLFAKMWRIYKIFDRRVLKVVKISNEKLGLMVGVLVAFDLLLNLVWQIVSPIYVADRMRLENGRERAYAQCTGDAKALPFLLIATVMKFVILVFGSFMGFTTRNVASAFNESKTVSWAIYNVFFSVAIIVPILFFSDAIGDSFTILIVFLLFWIAACTLALNFGSKFILLFKSEEWARQSSHQTSEKGGADGAGVDQAALFAFPSIAAIPKGVLDRYIGVLEAQMRTAKQRHRALLEEGANGGAEKQIVSNAHQPNQQVSTGSQLHNRRAANSSRGNMSEIGNSPVATGGAADAYRMVGDREDQQQPATTFPERGVAMRRQHSNGEQIATPSASPLGRSVQARASAGPPEAYSNRSSGSMSQPGKPSINLAASSSTSSRAVIAPGTTLMASSLSSPPTEDILNLGVLNSSQDLAATASSPSNDGNGALVSSDSSSSQHSADGTQEEGVARGGESSAPTAAQSIDHGTGAASSPGNSGSASAGDSGPAISPASASMPATSESTNVPGTDSVGALIAWGSEIDPDRQLLASATANAQAHQQEDEEKVSLSQQPEEQSAQQQEQQPQAQ